MPKTAFSHFQEDLQRARAIIEHARSISESELKSDLLRSAWMFSVGAMDAYFCDAYVDLIAATLISKSRQLNIELPEFFLEIKAPVRIILEDYDKENWKWRMAARDLMERENVLRLETVQSLFNKFLPEGCKFFREIISNWIIHKDAKIRLFAVESSYYQTLTGKDKSDADKAATNKLLERFRAIIQRRHDCIHNCDRPKRKPQPLKEHTTVVKVAQDIEFLVSRCNEHIDIQFKEFLRRIGCSAATIKRAGY